MLELEKFRLEQEAQLSEEEKLRLSEEVRIKKKLLSIYTFTNILNRLNKLTMILKKYLFKYYEHIIFTLESRVFVCHVAI